MSASGAEGGGHSAPIHALSFSADGRLLLTGSEDKLLKVWCADSWRCVRVLSAPKKISAAAFSANASHVMFADKFGDVQVGATGPAAPPPAEGSAPAAPAPVPGSLLLGHFCAVVTSLQATADGKYVISTDRESKVRVSAMPKEPTKVWRMVHRVFCVCMACLQDTLRRCGVDNEVLLVTLFLLVSAGRHEHPSRKGSAGAVLLLHGRPLAPTSPTNQPQLTHLSAASPQGSYEIQSYCLGHTSFVTSSALAAPGSGLLLTSGGDGAVRLWAYESGKLLDTYQVATPAQAAPQADAAAAAAAGASGAAAGEAGEAGGESGSGEDEGEDDGDDAAAAGGDGGDAEPANGCSIRQRVDCAPVLSVAVHGCTVAAVVEGSQEVTLLDIQPPPAAASSSGAAPTYRLAFKQKLAMPQDIFLPCQVWCRATLRVGFL